MAKKKIEKNQVITLGDDLVETLNKKFDLGGDKAAYYLSDPASSSDVTHWVSTGTDVLDLAISNRPNGGLPVGRIVEVAGLEASGKSLLSAHLLKNTQKMGGLAIYIDTEEATSKEFFEAIGVDIDKLVYLELNALEDIFTAVETTIDKVRSKNKDVLVTIVVDSVMGASTLKELEAEWDKEGWATDKAIILSKAMRKLPRMIAKEKILLVFTNQLRTRLGVSFGDPWTTSGGKAIGFAASVRLRLKQMGKIKATINKMAQAVGIKTRAIVQKNRVGPPHREADYEIYFESGIDNYGGWLNKLKDFKLVTSASGKGTVKTEYLSTKIKNAEGKQALIKFDGEIIDVKTGEIIEAGKTFEFRTKDFARFMDTNPTLRKFIYDMLCDYMIMTYKVNEDFSIDDTELDESVAEDELTPKVTKTKSKSKTT